MVVLIVQNSPLMIKVFEQIIFKAGHGCIAVMNGQEAMTCLEADPDIDLIISDIEMPELDGVGLFREVRGRVEWSNIPVILTPVGEDPSLIVKATQIGCNHFIIKPPDEVQVLRKIREAVGEEVPVLLKKSVAMNRYGLTSETYEELIEVFAKEVEDIIPVVEHNMENGELTAGAQAALQIRESAELFGAERITQHFSSLPKKIQRAEEEQLHSLLPFFLRELKLLQKTLQSRSIPPLQT